MQTLHNDRAENRKITILDVAEALNVSKTTVSRAISGKGRISEATRQKVLDFIEENDYKPNFIAKGLAQKKTYNIALVIPGDCSFADIPFFQNSMQGICEEASANDYDVMLVTIVENSLKNLKRMVANNKVDGVILSRPMVKDKAVEFLKKYDIPFVLMGTSMDHEIVQVDNDHRAGCCELVEHLIKSGIMHIGLIGGSRSFAVNCIRRNGYMDAFRNMGREVDKRLIFDNCDTPQKVELATKRLLDEHTQCIICMDDVICAVVLQALARKRINVPEKMKIAAFYDSSLLGNSTPAITSLRFDDKALGRLACNTLLRSIQGAEVNGRTLLGYELVSRRSAAI